MYDEERTISPHLSFELDLHDDLVVAGSPPGSRSLCPSVRAMGQPHPFYLSVPRRSCARSALYCVDPQTPHCFVTLAVPPQCAQAAPPDDDRCRPTCVPDAHRLRPAVARHHLACHRPTLPSAHHVRPLSGVVVTVEAMTDELDYLLDRLEIDDLLAPVRDGDRHPPMGRAGHDLRRRGRLGLPLGRRRQGARSPRSRLVARRGPTPSGSGPSTWWSTGRSTPAAGADAATTRSFYNPNGGATVDGNPWLFVVGGTYHDRLLRTPAGVADRPPGRRDHLVGQPPPRAPGSCRTPLPDDAFA